MIKKSKWNGWLGLALLATMVSSVALSGCGGGGDDDDAPTANKASSKAKDEVDD